MQSERRIPESGQLSWDIFKMIKKYNLKQMDELIQRIYSEGFKDGRSHTLEQLHLEEDDEVVTMRYGGFIKVLTDTHLVKKNTANKIYDYICNYCKEEEKNET